MKRHCWSVLARGDGRWKGGTDFSAADGPRGIDFSAVDGPGGPVFLPRTFRGGPLLLWTNFRVTVFVLKAWSFLLRMRITKLSSPDAKN